MAGKMVLLDGYSLMYRAFHGLQAPMSAPDGTPTNAVHGFMMMLMKVIEEERPQCLAVAFDMHAVTLRAQRYSEYKATRKPMPDALRVQDSIIRALIAQMGIPILEAEGYEADDILGTVSAACEREGREAVLVTGDRDSFQLAGDRTTILYTKKGITETVRVTPTYIRETYGLTPSQLIDVKGLMGDASDNIPGVPGVGEKTALKLIGQYGSLEKLLDAADTEQKGKLRQRLMEHRALAVLSKELATIVRDVPVNVDFPAWELGDLAGGLTGLRELRMNAAARRLEDVARAFAPRSSAVEAPQVTEDLPEIEVMPDVRALRERCEALATDARWTALALDAEVTVATDRARLCLKLGGDLLSAGADEQEALDAVRPLLASECPKIVWDLKSLPMEEIRGRIMDVMLAAYVLNPQRKSYGAAALCQEEGIDGFGEHPATALRRLAERLDEDLRENGLEAVYREIELPLTQVLREMEQTGFLVDAGVLDALGGRFRTRIQQLTEEIAGDMGARINLNSPKQLGEMLFEKMGIPAGKKTTRGYSTNAEVLEGLAEAYPVCGKILEYRKYQKLESTYIQSLSHMRDGEGRVHTRFDQVGTATGRLSSAEPNLQNIPVRTELGREIRRAFIAPPGHVLVDADYSQIELRVLAHISGDETMIDAFREGQDIHARTAAEVYGVPLDQVTGAMRSASKAVNFGIVYGISDFALAKNINVSRREAGDFIGRYLERYSGVKRYMEESVQMARAKGYAETMMGRRRYLPELSSANFNLRSFGERCAMNSPIQGSAADIIKMAMIAVARTLKGQGLRARLILQVHDELIIEAPEEEAGVVQSLLKDCMESVVQISVPLKAEISLGGDWCACK